MPCSIRAACPSRSTADCWPARAAGRRQPGVRQRPLMQVIPSLDLQNGRSRLVWWPGASTGIGHAHRPARGHRRGSRGPGRTGHPPGRPRWRGRRAAPPTSRPSASVARAVAKPLQLAGGVDGPEQIEIAFAAGATRVVMPLWAVVEDHALLADCLRIGGDWLAVGIDARPESLHGYPWRHRREPRLAELVIELHAAGVRRFVFSHVPARRRPAGRPVRRRPRRRGLVAGGVTTLDGLRRLRDAGVRRRHPGRGALHRRHRPGRGQFALLA